jgi:formate-dependent nitrite reductase membrane component NrfD
VNRDAADEARPADSYYGQPIINPPVWEEREIAGYLFFGGLAGASSILAAAADVSDRPHLAGRARLGASAAVTISFGALIKDLGRPERFVSMLRVFKPTSPMSVGTWILSAYAPLNYLASATTITRRAPVDGRAAGVGAALLGSTVATYTSALIADTAVPAWHEGYRELPFLFAGSAAAAAGGFGLMTAPVVENAPAARMALIGSAAELITERLLERRIGPIAKTLHSGVAGRRMRAAKVLMAAGLVGTATGARRTRARAALTGAALVTGSALTRFGVFAAGMESARDPRYTVQLQRARVEAKVTLDVYPAAGGAAAA